MRVYKLLPNPKTYDEEEWFDPTLGSTMIVLEIDEPFVETGLIDKRGHSIIALKQINPVGFIRKF